jgi:hypothetical protein
MNLTPSRAARGRAPTLPSTIKPATSPVAAGVLPRDPVAELVRIVTDTRKQAGPTSRRRPRALGVSDALPQPGGAGPRTRSWPLAGEDPKDVRR